MKSKTSSSDNLWSGEIWSSTITATPFHGADMSFYKDTKKIATKYKHRVILNGKSVSKETIHQICADNKIKGYEVLHLYTGPSEYTWLISFESERQAMVFRLYV